MSKLKFYKFTKILVYMSKKICENCKYEDYDLFGLPCKDCIIGINDKWEPKDAKTEEY